MEINQIKNYNTIIMKNTIKKSWRDVTIDEYFELVDKLNDPELEETDKEVYKLSFINNIPEDNIWNLNIGEFRKLQIESLWMDDFKIQEDVKFKSLDINGSKYTIDTNLQNFTVAQYIDFQTFFPKHKTNPRVLGNILACFIIPQGKEYASGYDIYELVRYINSNLDILTANEIMFFFLKQYLISIRATANYFNWTLKKLKKNMKNKEKLAEIEIEWEEMKKTILDGLHLLIM